MLHSITRDHCSMSDEADFLIAQARRGLRPQPF
jgi:hypothetical protein